ncbi:hypothetical protein SMICM304S_00177 [Streptomyces microflavus]
MKGQTVMPETSRRGLLFGASAISAGALLTACTSNEPKNAQPASNSQPAADDKPGKPVTIGFAGPQADHGWLNAINVNAKSRAEKYSEVTLEITEGSNDTAAQIGQVKTLINKKVDVLVILPADGKALTQVGLEAMRAGTRRQPGRIFACLPLRVAPYPLHRPCDLAEGRHGTSATTASSCETTSRSQGPGRPRSSTAGTNCRQVGAKCFASPTRSARPLRQPDRRTHQGIAARHLGATATAEGVRSGPADRGHRPCRPPTFGVDTVIGFTGSSIWHLVAMFPPVPPHMIERGYEDFAERWNPILDVFDAEGVRFAHEVHPSEIAYDYWTTKRALEAVDHRPAFGLNFDPSHFVWQDLDPVGFLYDFRDRIYHVDCKEARKRLDGRKRLGSHLPWGDPGAAGTSSPPATVTCPGRTSSGCSGPSATRARSPSSGRTRAWTGCTALRKRLPASSGSISTRRRLLRRGLRRRRVAPPEDWPRGQGLVKCPRGCLALPGISLSWRKQKFDFTVAQGLSVPDEQVYRPPRVHDMTRVPGSLPSPVTHARQSPRGTARLHPPVQPALSGGPRAQNQKAAPGRDPRP